MLKRFFIGFLLLIILLGFLLLWQLPRVVSVFAVPVLESFGLQNVELEVEEVGVGHANLSSLKFRYDGALASLQNVRLDWVGMTILDGQVATIDIDSLEVELDQNDTDESELSSGNIDLLFGLLATPLSKQIPVKDLMLGNLLIYQNPNIDQGSKSVVMDGSVELHKELGNVELSAVYRTESDPELEIKVSSGESGEYSASIKTVAGDELLALQAQLIDKQLLFDGVANQAILELGSAVPLAVLDEIEFSMLAFNGAFEREQKEDDKNSKLHGEISININDINYLEYKLEMLSSSFPIAIEPQEVIYADGWLSVNNEIAFELLGLELAGQLEPLDINATMEKLHYPVSASGEPFIQGRFFIDRIEPNNQEIPLVLIDVEQTFALNGDVLELTGAFNEFTRNLMVTGETKYNFSSGDLSARIRPAEVSFDDAGSFADLIASYELPLAIVTGQLESSFELDWNVKEPVEDLSVRGLVEFTNIGGAYDDYYFSGLAGAYSGSVYPVIVSDDTSVITVTQLDAGVAVRDLKAVLSLNQLNSNRANGIADGLEVQLFSVLANTMGGYIAIKPAQINLADQQHELSMLLIGIDIDTLLREQELEDVIASGKLSGEIPLLINDDGLSVSGGRVYAAEPGGKIQYKGDVDALSLAAGPAGFVFEALQDFNYGSMNIYPEYSPDGTLKMRLEVRGNNPQVEQGRPINFNINLEQNLLKLRESLRYVDGLNDEIDEKVQAFYRNRPKK